MQTREQKRSAVIAAVRAAKFRKMDEARGNSVTSGMVACTGARQLFLEPLDVVMMDTDDGKMQIVRDVIDAIIAAVLNRAEEDEEDDVMFLAVRQGTPPPDEIWVLTDDGVWQSHVV